MTIVLPIPSRRVSPNASRGHSKKAAIIKSRHVKSHKRKAETLAKVAISETYKRHGLPVPRFIGYSIVHYFATAAFRDDDNADAACKAYRDGIARALGVDDRTLPKVKLSILAKDAANPRVEITLHTAPPHA